MNTNIENALRTIEVARTKLQLLSNDDPDNADLRTTYKFLDDAHASLSGALDSSAIPAIAPIASQSSPSVDFTQIKKIDSEMAKNLTSAGVNNFADIAHWTADDVARLTQALSLGSQINRENWIEEAAILAKGGQTAYLKSLPEVRALQELEEDPEQVTEHQTVAVVPPEQVAAASAVAMTASTVAPHIEPELQIESAPESKLAEEDDTISVEIPTVEDDLAEATPVDVPDIPAEPLPTLAPVQDAAPDVQIEQPVAENPAAPNDAREASIEIKPRTDSQIAYPNSDEDPAEVVKRFMRALTGDSDKE